jgi:hypothetical protein
MKTAPLAYDELIEALTRGELTEEQLTHKDAPLSRESQILETVETAPPARELPTGRCYACKGWLFWVSIYGAVRCAACHPPANPSLVRRWYWLREGECKRTQ